QSPDRTACRRYPASSSSARCSARAQRAKPRGSKPKRRRCKSPTGSLQPDMAMAHEAAPDDHLAAPISFVDDRDHPRSIARDGNMKNIRAPEHHNIRSLLIQTKWRCECCNKGSMEVISVDKAGQQASSGQEGFPPQK